MSKITTPQQDASKSTSALVFSTVAESSAAATSTPQPTAVSSNSATSEPERCTAKTIILQFIEAVKTQDSPSENLKNAAKAASEFLDRNRNYHAERKRIQRASKESGAASKKPKNS